ncbi:MAG: ABC transporter substrate-binding protein, partial [Dehalococcoidia bacterium]
MDLSTSRRTLLRGAGLGVAGLAGAALIGCGDKKEDKAAPAAAGGSPQAAAPAAPKADERGGTLRTGDVSDLVWNTGWPFVTSAGLSFFDSTTMETLVEYDSTGAAKPLLAESFELNKDATKIVFKLKPNLEFHNGAPVTVEDVFFGLDLALDPKKFGATGVSHMLPFAKMITGRNKIDARTMEFSFDKKRVNINDLFTKLDVTHAASYPDLLKGKTLAGTGPYKFKSWTPGVGWELEPNTKWHLADKRGAPRLDSIKGRLFADGASAALAFEAGELDYLGNVTPANGIRFKDKGLMTVRPKNGTQYLGFNTKNPTLADPRVRKALYLGIDRARIAKDVGQGLHPVTVQPWPTTSPAFDPRMEGAFYDPSQAAALLKTAGFSQTKPLLISVSQTAGNQVAVAQIIQQNFKDIGVQTTVDALENGVFLQRLLSANYPDMFMSSHTGASDAPVSMFQWIFAHRLGDNPSKFDAQWYKDFIAKLEDLDP